MKTFFDRRELATGMLWIRVLELAIASSRAVAVLVGPQGLGNTQQYEREPALARHIEASGHGESFPVIPVILSDHDNPPAGFLQLLTWVDLSKTARIDEAPDPLVPLLAAIPCETIAPSALRASICPYRGLDAFREEDVVVYFGRGGVGEPTTSRQGGDTCHIDVIDRWGNMVSATPSGGWPLQSSPTIPTLGLPLGTRAQMFWLEPGLPSALAPGKRPRMTLTPSLALRYRDSSYPCTFVPRRVYLEARLDGAVAADLARRGHDIVVVRDWTLGWVSAASCDGYRLTAAASPRGMRTYAVGR